MLFITLILAFDSLHFGCALLFSSKVPSLQPLHYIDIPIVAQFIAEQTKESVVAFVIPQSFSDAAASIFTSGASGFIAGLVVSAVSVADGNSNLNDTSLIFAGSSGFYFATRSSVDVIGEIIGMSTPVVDVLAIILPIIVSELFKLRARAIAEQQTRVGKGPTMYELMKFERPSMKEIMRFREIEGKQNSKRMRKPMLAKVTPVELFSDCAKWLSYSAVFPIFSGVPLAGTAEAGATAGLISQLVLEREMLDEESPPPKRLLRCGRAALEGSFQFLTYEFSKTYIFGF